MGFLLDVGWPPLCDERLDGVEVDAGMVSPSEESEVTKSLGALACASDCVRCRPGDVSVALENRDRLRKLGIDGGESGSSKARSCFSP